VRTLEALEIGVPPVRGCEEATREPGGELVVRLDSKAKAATE
jgi:hypothetical protein